MTQRQSLKTIGTGTALAVLVLGGMLISPGRGQDSGNDDESRIQQGLAIAPVKLNLEGKDRALVGLGSYIVNAQVDCNGCHASAPLNNPALEWLPGGVPYFGQHPTVVNPQYYLGGGQHFTLIPGFPDIISRNLTPDKNGHPEGHTLTEFKEILRTGKDFDNIHPTCQSDTDPKIAPGICVPPPVDGSKLQVMPWPLFHNMTDHQIEAIYEYLSSIPCIDNSFSPPPAGAPNELRNDCGDPQLTRHAAALAHRDVRAKARR